MAELIEHSIPFNFEMAIGNVESSDGGKNYYLSGVATDNLPDKQNQRFSKMFIKNMVDSAVGMTCFYEHKRDLDHSIGYCKEANILEDALTIGMFPLLIAMCGLPISFSLNSITLGIS